MRDLEFKSASTAFIYAYGSRPPGKKQTWTPPGPHAGRTVRKHLAPLTTPRSQLIDARPSSSSDQQGLAVQDDDDEEEEQADFGNEMEDEEGEEQPETKIKQEDLSPRKRGKKIADEEEEEDEEEELSETEAELAYIEAKIRLLQIRKKKLLRQRDERSSKTPTARKHLDL